MVRVRHGDTVEVHYTGCLKNGTTFDSTRERGALRFVVGDGTTLSDFENAVVGMFPGETRAVEIPCRKAYGPLRRNMERVLRPDLVPRGVKVKVGQLLRIQEEDRPPAVVRVTGKYGPEVMVDLNHPLAGEDLLFEIELLKIL
jgi:peptidylprolyl isomerase